MTKKTTVVLLFGGRSSEHEISCVTAAGVLSAMDADRFEVIPVGITKAGATVLADEQVREFALTPGNMPQVSDNGTRIHWPESPESKTLTVTRANGSIDQLGEIVADALENDGEISLPGIGKLKVNERLARTGRNPATGKAIQIAAKKAVKLVPAKSLVDGLN